MGQRCDERRRFTGAGVAVDREVAKRLRVPRTIANAEVANVERLLNAKTSQIPRLPLAPRGFRLALVHS